MGKATKPPVKSSSSTATPTKNVPKTVPDLSTENGVDQDQLAEVSGTQGAGNSLANDMMSGTSTSTASGQGTGPAPSSQDATSTPPSPSAPANDQCEEEDKRELSEEEIDQEIDKAHAQAGPGQDGGPAAPGAPGNDGEAGEEKGEQESEGVQVAGGLGAGGGTHTVSDSTAPPPFQMEKNSSLNRWDNEVAWNDAFNTPGQCSQNFEVDREALIADALSDGALAGFQAGLINTGMDTVVNLAATKIPYISGFVELAQIAYDPEAWLQAQSQATFGKFSTGLDQIMNGDAWDKVEGTVNLLSGAVGVIGLLTNICWIVAGLGFLASFVCPAIFPFVGLCASWATSLSAISGIAFLILSLLQLGLVGMRATEIAVSDADPQDLLESGKSLENNTKGFTTAYTARAAGNMRERAANKMSGRNPSAKPDTPYNRDQGDVDAPVGKGWKALDLLTGNVANPKGLGNSSKASWDGAKNAKENFTKTNDAFLGRGDYKRGGDDGPSNTTAQKVADMEHAGANMFHSGKARENFYGKQAQSDGHDVKARAQTDSYSSKAKYYQDKDDVHAKSAADRVAKRQKAQQDLDDANTAYQKAQQDNEVAIKSKTDEVRARAALKSSFEEDLAASKVRLTDLETRRSTAAKNLPDNEASRNHLAELDVQIATAKTKVTQAESDVVETRQYHLEGVSELKAARQPVYDARGNVQTAEKDLATQTRMTELAEKRSTNSGNDRIEMDNLGQKAIGGKGVDAILAEEQQAADYDIFQAAAGKTPSAAHGMKKRHDRNLIKQVQKQSTDEEEAGGPLGLWQSTMDDKEIDWVGNPNKMSVSDDEDWFERFLDGVAETLPATPIHCPDKVDSSAAAWEALEAEEQELAQQATIAASLTADGQADVAELQGVQQVADTNLKAVDDHQVALDDRKTKQDEAITQAQESEGKMGEASGKAGENQGKSSGIVGRFLEMLGIVPTRFLPGGQGAKDGINQLSEASSAGVDATATGGEGAKEAQSAVGTMKEATTATKATDQAAATELTSIQTDAQVKEQSAQTGVDELVSAEASAAARLAAITDEQLRLEQVHDGSVLEAMNWTQTHEGTRIKGLGEYADVLKVGG